MRLLSAAISLAVVILLTVPLHAGIEPFFKGEWGMQPEEIKTFYDIEPRESVFDTNLGVSKPNFILTLTYPFGPWGGPTNATYFFNGETRALKMVSIPLKFKIDGDSNVKPIMEQIEAMILAAAPADDPFEATDIMVDRNEKSWLNKTTFVTISYAVNTELKSLGCHVTFFNTQDLYPSLLPDYVAEDIKTRLSNR